MNITFYLQSNPEVSSFSSPKIYEEKGKRWYKFEFYNGNKEQKPSLQGPFPIFKNQTGLNIKTLSFLRTGGSKKGVNSVPKIQSGYSKHVSVKIVLNGFVSILFFRISAVSI